MKRYLVCLALLAAPASAQELTGPQVLQKMRSVYVSLRSVHLVPERLETVSPRGHPVTSVSDCELAATSGNRYFARVKYSNEEAIAVSDGTNIWRALGSKKQWTKAAAALSEDNGEEGSTKADSKDLHGLLEGMLIGHFLMLAKNALDPKIVKEEDLKLGREKARGYLIRARTPGAEHELLVDRQRFVVCATR